MKINTQLICQTVSLIKSDCFSEPKNHQKMCQWKDLLKIRLK